MSKKGSKSKAKAAKPAETATSSKRKKSRSKGALPSAQIEALIREAGAFRVSKGAIDLANELIGQRGLDIARYAVEIARNAGRKTVSEDDIKLASTR